MASDSARRIALGPAKARDRVRLWLSESADTAHHHNSFFLTRNGGLKRIRAPMLNHFDDDIDSLIDLMEGEKHDKSWLDLRHAARPA